MEERRKEARARLSGWVEVMADGAGRRRISAIDLSVDGLGVCLDGARVPAGARVLTEFPLPGIRLPLELSAEVMWADAERAGLRFRDVDSGLRELLESFVAGRLPG